MKKFLIFAAILAIAVSAHVTLAELKFDHDVHAEQDLDCNDCHLPTSPGPNWEAPMPARETCLDCHDDDDLGKLPTMPSNHMGNFRYQHQYQAREMSGDCAMCHRNQESCTICHHGEDLDFLTHDRNWRYLHPMTYYKRTEDCFVCHDPRTSCQECHAANGVQPGSHYMQNWTSPANHGNQAKTDLSSCIQCHDGPDPVCKSCHD